MTLAKGATIGVAIEALRADGLGLAKEGLVVENALPGEAGDALVTHVGRARAHARLLSRTSAPAPERREELPCPRWTPASPCRLMHVTDEAQLAHKRAVVRDAFARAALDQTLVRECVAAPMALGWRARATYVVAVRDRVILGAYRRGTHVVQPMDGCPLETAAVARAARAIAQALDEVRAPIADVGRVDDDGACGAPPDDLLRRSLARPPPREPDAKSHGVRHVLIRAATRDAVAIVVVTTDGELECAEQVRRALQVPELAGLYVARAGAGDTILERDEPRAIGPARPLVELASGLELEISPASFFQANPGAAEKLHDHAARLATGASAVDVYSGVGAIALRIARSGPRVVGIESSTSAVANARRNAERNGLAAEFVPGDAALALEAVLHVDSVVVNPPRKGCSPAVLDQILRIAPERIVYVSCNPDTLGRDLGTLGDRYALAEATPYDLFPHSEHVEVVALATRARRS